MSLAPGVLLPLAEAFVGMCASYSKPEKMQHMKNYSCIVYALDINSKSPILFSLTDLDLEPSLQNFS